jgi:hypothetical protein
MHQISIALERIYLQIQHNIAYSFNIIRTFAQMWYLMHVQNNTTISNQ